MTRPTDAPQPMTAAEALEQAAKICEEEHDYGCGVSTPLLYWQIRERIRALAASLPTDTAPHGLGEIAERAAFNAGYEWAMQVGAPVSESGPLDQDALYRASWELQRHFGREGSIYGIKACEEIARIAIVAYGKRRTVGEEKP